MQRISNVLIQQSRVKWFREGDGNSAYFHKIIRGRRKVNEIQGLWINGRFVEEVQDLKSNVRLNFEENFKEEHCLRPTVDGLQFKKLKEEDNCFLVAPFFRRRN